MELLRLRYYEVKYILGLYVDNYIFYYYVYLQLINVFYTIVI